MKITDANSGEKGILIGTTTTSAFAADQWISVDIDLTDVTLFGTDPITAINAIVFAGNELG